VAKKVRKVKGRYTTHTDFLLFWYLKFTTDGFFKNQH